MSVLLLLLYYLQSTDIPPRGFQPIGAFHQRNHLAMGMGVPAQASGFGR